MNTPDWQVGKTRETPYGSGLFPRLDTAYRRSVLTGWVQVEPKRLMAACGEKQGLTVLAMETHEDHIHVAGSAPRFCPALRANGRKRICCSFLAGEVPFSQERVWKGAHLDKLVFCWHGERVSVETSKRSITDGQGKEDKMATGSLSSRPLERGGSSRS